MTKKLRHIFKYFESEKSFPDEIKRFFHHFKKAFIEAKKKIVFLKGESPTLISNVLLENVST